MSSVENMEAVDTARDYYNSDDADTFYSSVWGGEDIHIGLYQSEGDSVFEASRKTVQRMASKLSSLNKNTRVLDLGAGYCGAGRYLAGTYGARIVALNLSEVENERARKLNTEQNLDELIDVADGNYEEIPYEDNSFDVVWSQDAFLHSSNRSEVIKEAARVLKPDGEFVFTDPMKSDDCDDEVLQPILDRIHLESMASPEYYKKLAKENGFKDIEYEELTEHLIRHYAHILKETEANEEQLLNDVSQEYLDNMKKGLNHWVNGGQKGYLSWGIFHFRQA
ncbi:MAG TPA: methyltransferase domain-containing protein [Balneolales bacterium]|nr:methyltransferase domain-containing protein [Balneolales bacterium]